MLVGAEEGRLRARRSGDGLEQDAPATWDTLCLLTAAEDGKNRVLMRDRKVRLVTWKVIGIPRSDDKRIFDKRSVGTSGLACPTSPPRVRYQSQLMNRASAPPMQADQWVGRGRPTLPDQTVGTSGLAGPTSPPRARCHLRPPHAPDFGVVGTAATPYVSAPTDQGIRKTRCRPV